MIVYQSIAIPGKIRAGVAVGKGRPRTEEHGLRTHLRCLLAARRATAACSPAQLKAGLSLIGLRGAAGGSRRRAENRHPVGGAASYTVWPIRHDGVEQAGSMVAARLMTCRGLDDRPRTCSVGAASHIGCVAAPPSALEGVQLSADVAYLSFKFLGFFPQRVEEILWQRAKRSRIAARPRRQSISAARAAVMHSGVLPLHLCHVNAVQQHCQLCRV